MCGLIARSFGAIALTKARSGSRTCDTYSSLCALNQSRSLCCRRSVRKRKSAGVMNASRIRSCPRRLRALGKERDEVDLDVPRAHEVERRDGGARHVTAREELPLDPGNGVEILHGTQERGGRYDVTQGEAAFSQHLLRPFENPPGLVGDIADRFGVPLPSGEIPLAGHAGDVQELSGPDGAGKV